MSGLPDDWVERAAAAVRATPAPAMPPGLMRAVAKGVTAEARRARRRRLMRYAVMCGLFVALGASAWLVGAGNPAQAALLRALQKHEAKSYRATVRTDLADGTTRPGSEQTAYFAGGKLRTESADGSYAVGDPATGVFTLIDPAAKTATELRFAGPAPMRRDPYSVMMGSLSNALAAKGRIDDLGTRVVAGRRLRGYRHRGEAVGPVTETATFWLDPNDQALVRYESYDVPRQVVEVRGAGGRVTPEVVPDDAQGPTTTVFEFSDFGAEFDAKLFDAAPPAGYKRMKPRVVGAPAATPGK